MVLAHSVTKLLLPVPIFNFLFFPISNNLFPNKVCPGRMVAGTGAGCAVTGPSHTVAAIRHGWATSSSTVAATARAGQGRPGQIMWVVSLWWQAMMANPVSGDITV